MKQKQQDMNYKMNPMTNKTNQQPKTLTKKEELMIDDLVIEIMKDGLTKQYGQKAIDAYNKDRVAR